MPVLEEAFGWRNTFAWLAIGPLIGTAGMVWLYTDKEARAKIAHGKG